ncbi:hypothetical protein [Pseudomonas sp. Fl4BN1]|uniref:hypothetical protein n=1 Tax=Pseudomonas sp. Fl4BN1 TaxID=2697651 RepID=UPI001378EC13|nr:hypothetical protein [Pseudomonas sp. Fl4BN1]NBF13570.1 hypothetical protein [Pseudomonas sp. Fl4BN1]
MIRINLHPLAIDARELEVSVHGNVLTVSGKDFDLGQIPVGYRLPASAADPDVFVYELAHESHGFEVTLIFPIRWDDPKDMRFPEPIIVTSDGPVPLPKRSIMEEFTIES